jgi:two-component system sensor histidine kinase YesM
MHVVGIVIPVTIISVVVLAYIYSTLLHYNESLLESDNRRVSATLYEITAQIYTASSKVAYDKDTWNALSSAYERESTMREALGELSAISDYAADASVVDFVEIYTDNPDIHDYLEYRRADSDIRKTDWYRSALTQQSPFWAGIPGSDRGEDGWNICLIRRIPMQNSAWNAVLVIGLDDSFLKTRLSSKEYGMALSIDRKNVVFASDPAFLGAAMSDLVPLDYGTPYYRYTGRSASQRSMAAVSQLQPYRSKSVFYVASFNDVIYPQIQRILFGLFLIFALAIIAPTLISRVFSLLFTRRVARLRSSMHTVSEGNYDIAPAFEGGDELSEIYRDLLHVVARVQDADRKVYAAQLQEKELERDQQAMRFQMLASQINPHFLYNTLESIRMKALAEGSRSTADAIKTLGKIMRYVLNSSVTAGEVPLSESIAFAREYMSIMKFRFGERIGFHLEVGQEVDSDRVYVMPLLMQPVIENAVLHGLDEVEEGGSVDLAITREEDRLEIVIRDNGCGMDEKTLQSLRERISRDVSNEEARQTRHGLALHNIAERIRIRYGDAAGIRVDSKAGTGTTVTLTLPYLVEPQ